MQLINNGEVSILDSKCQVLWYKVLNQLYVIFAIQVKTRVLIYLVVAAFFESGTQKIWNETIRFSLFFYKGYLAFRS